MASTKKKGMTPKQKKFCDYYLISGDAKDSAIKAGYSKKTAGEIGYQLLHKTSLQNYIAERQKINDSKTEITYEMVLAEYAKIAFFDIRKAYNENDALKRIQDLDDKTAGAIVGIESFEQYDSDGNYIGTNKKIKVSDKRAALDSICRMLGYNAAEKREVTGKGGQPLFPPVLYLPEKEKDDK